MERVLLRREAVASLLRTVQCSTLVPPLGVLHPSPGRRVTALVGAILLPVSLSSPLLVGVVAVAVVALRLLRWFHFVRVLSLDRAPRVVVGLRPSLFSSGDAWLARRVGAWLRGRVAFFFPLVGPLLVLPPERLELPLLLRRRTSSGGYSSSPSLLAHAV